MLYFLYQQTITDKQASSVEMNEKELQDRIQKTEDNVTIIEKKSFDPLFTVVHRIFNILMDWISLILLQVLPGAIGNYVIAFGIIFAVSLLSLAISGYRCFILQSIKIFPKILDVAILLLNFALFLYNLIAQPSYDWSHSWTSVIINGSLLGVVLFSILIGHPFTIQYAKDVVEETVWTQPGFYWVNLVITIVWAVEFALSLLFSLLAIYFYPDNTVASILPGIIVLIGALLFTKHYPAYIRRKIQIQRENAAAAAAAATATAARSNTLSTEV